MNYYIYSDGSDFKKTTHRLGIGAVLVKDDGSQNGLLIDELSEEISLDLMKSDYNTLDCSNPTMEMLAAKRALEKFSKYINKNDTVTLFADYLGVREWNTGKWKINKPYIRLIKEETQKLIKDNHLIIKFEWVKGHLSIMDRDSFWNNKVDKLSKGITD